MTRTVDDLRNDIRRAVGRHERIESTAFTKEALAAIQSAVDRDVDTDTLPPKARMRARIRASVTDTDLDAVEADGPFRKADLERIADALESADEE
ncbi:hypothetical protein [Halanaeroarchaeum sulfurireducens]|uniref:Uncharacterized protein n=1 Tax=Halanaeroarchaeum sulfurireducens TaxID=1604004 RepID=A0A0F7PFD9_9EURY|nr:hypothetical protein [Halanaeroarchaeum sulfurireducens]AKH98038.1 hypothetical protein HLASF_1559 [Halanaeroarchaeum sulfurireducens]ALG82432.1 hypothetical protein HLASA_1546 [Halanaeroarchaeum sulfurireducens]